MTVPRPTRTATILAAAALLSFVPPMAAAAPDSEPTAVAIVNGEAVQAEAVAELLSQFHASAADQSRGGFDLDTLMTRLINDTLIAQEARAMDMHLEEPTAGEVVEYRQRLATRRLQLEEISSQATVSDAEARRAFEDQYQRVTFRVLTTNERHEAEHLLALLREGTDFEQLVGEHSIDPYRLRGGLVNSLPRIDLTPEMADLVFALAETELGGPVRTDLGWSVVRVESFESADPESYQSKEESVRALVRQLKSSALRSALSAELRQRHPVTVDRTVVDAVQPERSPDSRLVPRVGDPRAIVATIGENEVITTAEYGKALLGRWKRVRNLAAADASAPIVLESLIEGRLLLAEAVGRGYADSAEVAKAARSFETQLLIPRYLEEVVAADIEVSEDEKLAYYRQHREEFNRPPRVRLGQITVGTRDEAATIAERLRQGTDLAWLARQRSADAFAEKGGDRGWYSPVVGTQDFNQDLLQAPVGAVLEPFGSMEDWIVLKVLDRIEPGPFPYDEVSGNVREKVFSEKFRAALHEFVETLRSRSEIEIREDVLANLKIEASMQGESKDGGEVGGHGH